MQRSRANQAVSDDTVAAYTAARAFLMGEWFGACVVVASFTLLYAFILGARMAPVVAIPVCAVLSALGGFVFWRNRTYYSRLDFPWAMRWHVTALVVAGAGAIFWLLFVLLSVLAAFGVNVGPAAG